MSSDRIHSLFFELFSGLPRQGPGDAKSTRRALSSVPKLSLQSRILDIGCGTGAQTFVLAEATSAQIVAIDNHPPYVDEVNRKAVNLNISDRVIGRVADMRLLDFTNDSFDLIWCEGAIYNLGVEDALQDWRKLLRKDGSIAFTEVCWRKPNPPVECKDFWEREYPAIRTRKALITAIKASRYVVLDQFELPTSAWWSEYYRPLQSNISAFRKRYEGDKEAEELCDQCEYEIAIWRSYAEFYVYEFLVVEPSQTP